MALNPVGPLAPGTYWRRRALVAAGVVVLLALLLRACGGGGGARRDTLSTRAGATTTGAATPSATGTAAPVLPSPPPASTAPGTTGPGTASPGATSPAATAPGTTAPVATGPAAGTPSPGRTAAMTTAPADTCPDRVLVVTAAADATSYPLGARPVLTLSVRNSGSVPCRRDLGSAAVGLQVTSGSDRVWSSDDCSPGGQRGSVVLQAGELHTTRVTWAGRRSAPGCAGPRTAATAGTYRVAARVGDLVRSGATFVLGST